MNQAESHQCSFKNHFSLTERLLMRIGWFGFMLIGTYGIHKQTPVWAWGYVVFAILGFILVVLPLLCAHCPYPYQYNTCLFLPPGLLRRFFPYKGPKMNLFGKIAVFVALAGMVVIPNFWLVKDWPLFILFWLVGLPIVAAFPAYYCQRCRHTDCPMNKVAKEESAPV